MSKRYCSLLNCENNKGCTDKEVLFFRLPKEADVKILWINAIKTWQIFDENSLNTNFLICEKHFGSNEIDRSRKRNKLIPNAVPRTRYFLYRFAE